MFITRSLSQLLSQTLIVAVAVGFACDADNDDTAANEDRSAEDQDVDDLDEVTVDELELEGPGPSEQEPQGGVIVPSFDIADDVDPNAVYGSWVSEEDPATTCPSGQLVSAFDCSGSYCDYVRLDCSRPGTANMSTRTWTTWFSEESTNYRICSGTGYVTGITCSGSYCDNISLECTTTGLAANSCSWSGYFSEEDPEFRAQPGYYIKGVQCNGSRCDNKRYYTCRP